MRTTLVLFVSALLALAVAVTARGAAPADGSLTVRDGRGTVILIVRGAIIGRLARGSIRVEELGDDEDSDPVVRGWERVRWQGGVTPTYSGQGVRFRLIGGRYRLRIHGNGIQLTAVGRGQVMLDGAGSEERGLLFDGVYSFNGETPESLPDEPIWFRLVPPPPPPPPSP